MRDDILERKIARIIILLAEALKISEEQALDMFYASETYCELTDATSMLHLRADGYILEDVLKELSDQSADLAHTSRQ